MAQRDTGMIVHVHLFPQQWQVRSSSSALSEPEKRITVLPDTDWPVDVGSFTKPYRQEGIFRNSVDCVNVNCPSASVRI